GRRGGTTGWASSFCRTTTCARAAIPEPSCSSSSTVRSTSAGRRRALPRCERDDRNDAARLPLVVGEHRIAGGLRRELAVSLSALERRRDRLVAIRPDLDDD